MTTIRRYRPADAGAIARLNDRALAETGTDPDDVPGIDDIENVEREYLQDGEFLVAEQHGRVVGMGGLTVDGDEGELFRMRVDPDRQGEGVGSRLLDALEHAADKRGVNCLYAETARRQSNATRFYPSNGYERVKERTFGEYDLITYAKDLDGTAPSHRG